MLECQLFDDHFQMFYRMYTSWNIINIQESLAFQVCDFPHTSYTAFDTFCTVFLIILVQLKHMYSQSMISPYRSDYQASECKLVSFVRSSYIHCFYHQHGSKYLDQAFLHFFEQFRMVYVGDVIQKTCGVSPYLLLFINKCFV